MNSNESKAERREAVGEALIGLGVFRTADALAFGFSRWTIMRMAECGELIRVAHGFYYHPRATVDVMTVNYSVATLRFGDSAVIGGLTALYHYGLLDEGPPQVWVMVPHSVKARVPHLFRVLRTKHDPAIGVIDHGSFRMVTVERAIVEAFAYATKVGRSTALVAGRTALREKKVTERSIHEMAVMLGREALVSAQWEALTTR